MSKSVKGKNVILTGFMGTGKTTVGVLLAKNLNYEFVDTDRLIEKQCAMSIPAFFKEEGEAAFRKKETGVAEKLAEQNSLVISTGGGFMLNPVNAGLLEKTGRIFCLIATPNEIFQRISQGSVDARPLLQVSNPRERIIELLQERREGYARFSQLSTSGKTPSQIVQDIIDLL